MKQNFYVVFRSSFSKLLNFHKRSVYRSSKQIFFWEKAKKPFETSIPEYPIQIQIKDTQFISIRIREELNKIIGNENVITTGGVIDYQRIYWVITDKFNNLLK